jgi:hypothetical protein
MYLENRSMLHIIDRGTRFSTARFLRSVYKETTWTTFIGSWSSLYVGFPHINLTDHGSAFMSRSWRGMCAAAEIELRNTGVETHHSLNVVETLHAPLILQRARDSHPGLSDKTCLSQSVPAMNDTFNADGLRSTFLVLGVRPKLLGIPFQNPSNIEIFHAAATALKEYESHVALESNKKASSRFHRFMSG